MRKLSLSEILGLGSVSSMSTVDLFSQQRDADDSLHRCYFSRVEDRLGMPVAVRPANDDSESFFSDAATYYPSFVPVSAYMHVLSTDIDPMRTPSISLGTPESNIAVGVAIGELLSLASFHGAGVEHVNYGGWRRSLTYAVFRSLALHPEFPPEYVVERWRHAREVSGMEFHVELASTVCTIANLHIFPSERLLGEDIYQILSRVFTGRSKRKLLEEFFAKRIGLDEETRLEMSGPFEGRISAFTAVIQSVRTKGIDPETAAICIAFYCDEILSGSLSHFRLLLPLLRTYPSILLWYGFFGAASTRFDLTEIFAGLGLKMSRDLFAAFSYDQRPNCDISIEELAVLARLPLNANLIKPQHPRTLSVALMPGVDTVVRFGLDEDSMRPEDLPSRESNASRVDAERALMLLREALDLLEPRQPPKRPSRMKPPKR